jgi:hypothetical protein
VFDDDSIEQAKGIANYCPVSAIVVTEEK